MLWPATDAPDFGRTIDAARDRVGSETIRRTARADGTEWLHYRTAPLDTATLNGHRPGSRPTECRNCVIFRAFVRNFSAVRTIYIEAIRNNMAKNGVRSDGTSAGASDTLPADILSSDGMDRVMDILANRHRRLMVLSLKRGGVETETDLMFRSSGREEAEMALRHTHLPKLEEAGYVEWNRETGEVSKGSRFDEIEPILELIENHSDELPPGWP
jgi:hypothetical protein